MSFSSPLKYAVDDGPDKIENGMFGSPNKNL